MCNFAYPQIWAQCCPPQRDPGGLWWVQRPDQGGHHPLPPWSVLPRQGGGGVRRLLPRAQVRLEQEEGYLRGVGSGWQEKQCFSMQPSYKEQHWSLQVRRIRV